MAYPPYIAMALALLFLLTPAFAPDGSVRAAPPSWEAEWPNTNFSKRSVSLDEIMGGGPPKDGIPSIDNPKFIEASAPHPLQLAPSEPVIAYSHGGDARAYPLRILMRHEIVNDVVGGKPVTVTYCPLCDAAIVFDSIVREQVLEFGTTGKLRNSDLVMYDRQTESWWQQFTGEAIVGKKTGTKLKMLPARVESLARFKERHPGGKVLLPAMPFLQLYANPYVGYDQRRRPYPFFQGEMPKGVPPMARVVAVGDRAWTLELLREKGRIEEDGFILEWAPGQNSALDDADISQGWDLGNVTVQRKTEAGLEDVVYDVTFAFAFHAFYPKADIRTGRTRNL